MDDFEVGFAPRAERDLHGITRYIARHSGSDVAHRFGNQLVDRALTLARHPERGRVVPELRQTDVREIILRSYRIIYRMKASSVEVIRFWHAARGAPAISSDDFKAL